MRDNGMTQGAIRGIVCVLLSAALCVTAALGVVAPPARAQASEANPFELREVFFCNEEGELWLVGRMNPPTQPLAVTAYITLPSELRLPDENTYLYPVDENGYFALPAGAVDEQGVLISKYDIYVTDGNNPPHNDYSQIKNEALSHAVFDLTGREIDAILKEAPALPELVAQRVRAGSLVARTPGPSMAPTATPVATAEPTATPDPTVEPTATPEPTIVPTAEPTATPEPTVAPTAEPTATPKPTAEPTATPEPTIVPTAEPTATPEPTVEPTAEPTATPEPTVEPTAEPTATPEPTVVVTVEPTPAPMTEAMAERYTQVLLQTELNPEASAAYKTGINDILLQKMQEAATVMRSADGGYQALIVAPDFDKSPNLPKYGGETPSSYAVRWQNALRAAAESRQTTGGKTLALPVPAEGEWSETARDEFRAWLWGSAGVEVWLRQGIEQSGIYGAMSRLLLPLPKEQNWLADRFIHKDQAPQFATEEASYGRMVRGSKGDEVRIAQQALIALGYLPEGEDDGIFGRNMEAAVKAFQKANGLKEDGILASKTQAALFTVPEGITIKDVMASNGVPQADVDAWWPVFVRSMYDIEWNAEEPGMPVLFYLTVDYDIMAGEVAAELNEAFDKSSLKRDELEAALLARITDKVEGMERSVRREMRLTLLCESEVVPEAFIASMGSSWIENNFRHFVEAVGAARQQVEEHMGE